MLGVMGLSLRAWAADQASACETCHVGIESMHADLPMGCVDCHGGNDKATSKEQAHVQPENKQLFGGRPFLTWSGLNFESPEFVRFLNPGDLRIADQTCGSCHADEVRNTRKSIMATNASRRRSTVMSRASMSARVREYTSAQVSSVTRTLKTVPTPKTHEGSELKAARKNSGRALSSNVQR